MRREKAQMRKVDLARLHRDRPYQGGRSNWVKVKKRQHAAFNRVMDALS